MKMKRLIGKRGFTLIEVMIVVAIIGVLAAIVIPSFIKSRATAQRSACEANLKEMDGAKMIYALENNAGTGAPVIWGNLVTDYVSETPSCPAGGDYTIGHVGTTPTCATSGHAINVS